MAVRLPPKLRPLWPQFKIAYTHATRAASPITRQVSRLRGGYLPRRAVATIDESVADGGRMWVARPEERVIRTAPGGEPPRHPRFVCHTDLLVPRVAVAELPGGRVLGPHRVVVDGHGRMIEEFGLYWGTKRWSEHQAFWHPFPEPPLEVSGVLGVIAGRGDLNYYHFVMDILPRLALLETPGVPRPDRWYLPLQFDWQRELLELAGIELTADVVDADRIPHVRAETLLVPGMPDVDIRTPRWVVPWVRERVRPRDLDLIPGRRIYVTRGRRPNNRIVANEDEVVELLAEHGFEVVDPGAGTLAEEMTMFGEAEWIVGPHGAAMTNLIWASPGASVIELFAPDYVEASYWKLVDCIPGMTYRYLIGAGPRPRKGRDRVGVMSDITVDLAALRRALDALPTAPHAREALER